MNYNCSDDNNWFQFKGKIKSTKYNIMAPTYVHLASNNSTFVTGQIIHINGGKYFG